MIWMLQRGGGKIMVTSKEKKRGKRDRGPGACRPILYQRKKEKKECGWCWTGTPYGSGERGKGAITQKGECKTIKERGRGTALHHDLYSNFRTCIEGGGGGKKTDVFYLLWGGEYKRGKKRRTGYLMNTIYAFVRIRGGGPPEGKQHHQSKKGLKLGREGREVSVMVHFVKVSISKKNRVRQSRRRKKEKKEEGKGLPFLKTRFLGPREKIQRFPSLEGITE